MEPKEDRHRKSLRYSVMDGTFAASMIGFGESFFVAFALFIRANNIQVGLLSSLPQSLGSAVQLFSNRLIRLFRSRKRLVAAAALLQGLMYIPIALVYYFGTLRVYHLIFFACLYWVFGMVLSPAWNSWMGDLTDEKERGAYFGRRSKYTGFSSFASYLAAGYVLERFGSAGIQYWGFAAIFALALASRLVSFVFLCKKDEPPYRPAAGSEFAFLEFVKQARFRNYGLFVLYTSLMNFSVSVAAPFFTPYMLRDLRLDYMTFAVVNAAAIVTKVMSFTVWGRASDRFGRKKILGLTGFLMPVISALWLFSGNPAYLVLIQLYSGFVWGGFELSAGNFIFDATSPQKRATCVAYYNVINGAALITGAMLGSLIVRYNDVFWSKYYLVFLLSFFLRLAASSVFLPRLREVRLVEEIPYTRLFVKIISMMPTMGPIYGLIPFRKPRRNDKNREEG